MVGVSPATLPAPHEPATKFTSESSSRLDDIQDAITIQAAPTVIAKKCCWGLVQYDVPSSKTQELAKIAQKIGGDEAELTCIDTVRVNLAFAGVIVLNSLCIGLDILLADQEGNSAPAMVAVETVFLILFWIELALRIFYHRRRFCADFWGPFDFGVTFLGSIDAWVLTPLVGSTAALAGVSALRTLRLLRLFRLIRIFRAFRQLARLVKVLVGAFQSLTWVTLLLFVALYISTILMRIVLTGYENDSPGLQRLTQSVPWTLFYHLMALTVEGYLENLVTPTTQISIVWYLYWIVLVIFLNFFMVNLMVGLIVQRTMAATEEDDANDTLFVYEALAFKRTLLQLFQEKDVDEEGRITVDELVKMMNGGSMMHIMSTFGIKTDLPSEFLLTMMGFHNEKYISFTRFYESCVRICGASKDIRAFMLQYDISRLQHEVSQSITLLGKTLGHKESSKRIRTSEEALAGRSVNQAIDSIPFEVSFGQPPLPLVKSVDFPGKYDDVEKPPIRQVVSVARSPGFYLLANKAKKRLSILETRQEEILLSLSELRVALFGASHWTVICCKSGHPLMPLGTTAEPVGSAEYRHWTCDAVAESTGCRHGDPPGSHVTGLRRYHCAPCRFDLCQTCYNERLSKQGVKLNTMPPASGANASCPPAAGMAARTLEEANDSAYTPRCEGN